MLQALLVIPFALSQFFLPVDAQTTTATCTYALWTSNALGESPCLVWAKIQNSCTSGATVPGITPATAPYPIPAGSTANACNCNTVAYNLMAACTWCQPNLYSSDWVSETRWRSGCSSYSDRPPQSALSGVTVPAWALADNSAASDNSWESFRASSINALGTVPSATASSGGGSGAGSGSSTRTTSSFRSTSTFGSGGGFDDYVDPVNVGRAVGIALGVILAISVVFWGIGLAVFLIRQKNRKAWYGPVAAHYAGGGRPPWEDGGAKQPLMTPWTPSTPAPPSAPVSPAPYQAYPSDQHPYATPSPAPYYQDYSQAPGTQPIGQYDAYGQNPNPQAGYQNPQAGFANPHQTGTAYV